MTYIPMTPISEEDMPDIRAPMDLIGCQVRVIEHTAVGMKGATQGGRMFIAHARHDEVQLRIMIDQACTDVGTDMNDIKPFVPGTALLHDGREAAIEISYGKLGNGNMFRRISRK